MKMSGKCFSFWLNGVLVDSLTSYMFCTGKWKVKQIPPETFMPELNLQHVKANAIWQLRFILSLQDFCGEVNTGMASAAGTELHWVPLSLAATFFTLCCNTQREFFLPSDVYLNFTCVTQLTGENDKLRKYLFSQKPRDYCSRQPDKHGVSAKGWVFSMQCAMYMFSFTFLKGNRKLHAAVITAISLHKDYLLHPTAGFWNTSQKGGWNHQPHFI